MRRLVSDTAGCTLPCWWGITPGTTSWAEASQFFARFSNEVTIESTRQEQRASHIYQNFLVYYTSGLSIDYTVNTAIEVADGLIRLLYIDAEGSMASGFSPRKILNDLGDPDQVLVKDSKLVTLWYESRGVAATYLLDETPSHQLCISAFWGTLAWDTSDSASAAHSRSSVGYAQSRSVQEVYSISTAQFLALIHQGIPSCF